MSNFIPITRMLRSLCSAVILLCVSAFGLFAQSGLTGDFGTRVGAREYVSNFRSIGGDFEISEKGNLLVTGSGGLDIFGSFNNKGVVEILSGGTLNIFGDVENGGAIIAHNGAHIYFYGNRWKNTIYASFTDGVFSPTEAGGELVFSGIRPVIGKDWLAATKALQGYSGGGGAQFWEGASSPMDATVRLQNKQGVYLSNSAASVEGSLQWDIDGGMLYLGNNDLIFTANGNIYGYTPQRFAVTDGTGHVVRQRMTGAWTFPIGPQPDMYTPASVDAVTANTFHVNVTPYGQSPSVEGAPWRADDGMGYTWNIYADQSTGAATVALQHNSVSNRPAFDSNANFVSRYGPDSSNNQGDQWSPGYWELNNATASVKGNLSSTGNVGGSELNWRTYRSFATSAASPYAYYTKTSTAFKPLNTSNVWLVSAIADNCDAVVEFRSGSEFGVAQFQVQRSIDGINFTVVATFQPQGDSSVYTLRDLPPGQGDFYYRIVLLDIRGDYALSNTSKVSVHCKDIDPDIHLYPNPASDYITITGMTANSEIVLLNMMGRALYKASTDRVTHTIRVEDLPDDTYIVRVQSGPRFTSTGIKFIKIHK